MNLVVIYSFLESYPGSSDIAHGSVTHESGATFKNKLPLVPARLFQDLM